MKVTFFKVNNPSEKVKSQLFSEILTFVDVDKFEDEQVVEDFGYDGNNPTGIMFTFLPEDQTQKMIEALTKFDLIIECNDVTDSVLMNDFDTNKKWIELFVEDNVSNFSNILKNFLVNNLTKDMVLDKMNEKGFDSLTQTDLDVLNA